MKRIRYNILGLLALLGLTAPMFCSCSDEPNSENFYTFTGEMMSDYLKNRDQYSDFAAIVSRAGLMDLLATYGHYTCFVPDNDAVKVFLNERGLQSIDQLSDADCDTLARTHIISNMYTTLEMAVNDRLNTANMLGRYLATTSGFDNDSNAVVFLEGTAHVYFDLKDDSVENGIMQPVDMVIEKSNSYTTDVMRDNPKITTFYAALVATGVYDDVLTVEDPNWNPREHEKYYYRSHTWSEVGWVPDTKRWGHTFFIEPDSVLQEKYGIAKGDIRALYDKACEIYDKVYPQDVDKPGHSFENLKDSVNPLRRFIQYHILNKYVPGTADLTPLNVNIGVVVGAVGFDENLINPVDWHPTLLPHTMIKVEQLTMKNFVGQGKLRQRYINRRYDKEYQIEGQLPEGAKVVVVEDLISTGASSLKAVEALRRVGFEVVGMVASYTYGFPIAEKAFKDAKVKLVTLTDYEHVVAQALATGYIKENEVSMLQEWRKDPANWKSQS